MKFIAHFVRVYERTAPDFARESARWSLDEANCAAYISRGRTMPDVHGISLAQALDALMEHERAEAGGWPYVEVGDSDQ